MDYCNGFDLGALLKIRKGLGQYEISRILKKVVLGCRDLWKLNVIHRDIKLANVLLHFPDHEKELKKLKKPEKLNFLKTFDLENGNFYTFISDFGLSTIHDPKSTG